jgi:hypothetical protein
VIAWEAARGEGAVEGPWRFIAAEVRTKLPRFWSKDSALVEGHPAYCLVFRPAFRQPPDDRAIWGRYARRQSGLRFNAIANQPRLHSRHVATLFMRYSVVRITTALVLVSLSLPVAAGAAYSIASARTPVVASSAFNADLTPCTNTSGQGTI